MIKQSATSKLAALTRGLLAGGMVAFLGAVAPVSALLQQSSFFGAVETDHDRVVTRYELDQRILFMQLLRQPGEIESIALKGLIEDRLRFDLAKRLGLVVPPASLQTGMEEFASRANLTAEQFIAALGQAGVESQTFRDFVDAGLVWREIVRSKFGPSVSITEAEIDRALAGFVPTTALKARYSEIVLPATGADRNNAMVLARRLNGRLVPWAEGKDGWALSEVMASNRKLEALPLPDQDAPEVQEVRADWPKWKQAVVCVVAEDGGICEGLKYDPEMGLMFVSLPKRG